MSDLEYTAPVLLHSIMIIIMRQAHLVQCMSTNQLCCQTHSSYSFMVRPDGKGEGFLKVFFMVAVVGTLWIRVCPGGGGCSTDINFSLDSLPFQKGLSRSIVYMCFGEHIVIGSPLLMNCACMVILIVYHAH